MADVLATGHRQTIPGSAGQGTVLQVRPVGMTWTPTACRLLMVGNYTDDALVNSFSISQGFVAGAEQRAVAHYSAGGTGDARTSRVASSTRCLIRAADNGATAVELDALNNGAGPVVGGWDFYVSKATTGVEQHVSFLFYGGADLSPVVGHFRVSPSNGGSVLVTTGHTSDLVYFASSADAIPSGLANGVNSYGVAWNNAGVPVNCGHGWGDQDGGANANIGRETYTAIGGQTTWSSTSFQATVTAFGATDFTVQSSGSPSTDDIAYLSLALSGDAEAWAGFVDTPISSAADWVVTTPGIEPALLEMFVSDATQVDVYENTLQNVNMTFGHANGSVTGSHCAMAEHGAGTMQSKSHSSSDFIAQYNGLGSVIANQYTDVTLTSQGWTVPSANLAVVDTTSRKAIASIISAGGAAPPTFNPAWAGSRTRTLSRGRAG